MILNRVVLPAPLRPTSPTFAPVGQVEGGAVEDQPVADAVGQVVDVKHAAF